MANRGHLTVIKASTDSNLLVAVIERAVGDGSVVLDTVLGAASA
jgi:hypothetical protein